MLFVFYTSDNLLLWGLCTDPTRPLYLQILDIEGYPRLFFFFFFVIFPGKMYLAGIHQRSLTYYLMSSTYFWWRKHISNFQLTKHPFCSYWRQLSGLLIAEWTYSWRFFFLGTWTWPCRKKKLDLLTNSSLERSIFLLYLVCLLNLMVNLKI